MGRARRIGAIALASAALVSCTLLVDLDGLLEGSPDGGARDGSPETGAGDAEAGADATIDAPPADPCALPGVLYCTRFDNPKSLDAFRVVTDPTTRVEVVENAFFSAPAAAAFTIDPSNNSSADATLGITVGTNVSRTSFRGRVRIEKREAVAGRLLAMSVGSGDTILLDHAGNVHQSGVMKLGVVPAVPENAWVPIRMDLDGTVNPPTVTVFIGDAPPARFTASGGGWSPGEVHATFGISETSTPTAGWLVRWDDVAIQEL